MIIESNLIAAGMPHAFNAGAARAALAMIVGSAAAKSVAGRAVRVAAQTMASAGMTTNNNNKRRANDAATREFRELHASSGRTQSETAEYLEARLGEKVSFSKVSRWASGVTAVPARVLDAMREGAQRAPANAPVVASLTETADVVALFSYSSESGGKLRLSEEQHVQDVPLHPSQVGSKSAFAVLVFGDALSPRLRHGDVAYAIRNRTPHKGQPCVVELTTGEAVLRIFEGADDHTIFGSQAEPRREHKWPLRDVAALHAIVGVTFAP